MKNLIYLILCFTFCVNHSLGQKFEEKKLLGCWELVKTVKDPEFDLKIEVGENSNDESKWDEILLFFQPNNILDLVDAGEQFQANYLLKDTILRLGDTDYTLIKLNNEELIMVNYGMLVNTTYYYKRSEKIINPINEKELIEEKYTNGQIKIQGLKERGMRNGIWTEWYQGGKVKSVSFFNYEVLLMNIEYNETGQIISKTRLNFEKGEYIDEK